MTEQTPLQQAQEIFRRATQLCQALAAEEQRKKILERPDLQQLRRAITAAQRRTEEVAADDSAIRMDLQDAVADELKAWKAYSEGLEAHLFEATTGLSAADAEAGNMVPLYVRPAWLERVNRALFLYDQDRLDVRGVARELASGAQADVTIRDSAGAPLWTVNTAQEQWQQQEPEITPQRMLDRAQTIGAIQAADEYLQAKRVTETWRLVDRLRDELVRLAGHIPVAPADTHLQGEALTQEQYLTGADGAEKQPVYEGPEDVFMEMAAQQAAQEHLEAVEQFDPPTRPTQTPWPAGDEATKEHLKSSAHKPVQHRDFKAPWCNVCGLTASGYVPVARHGVPILDMGRDTTQDVEARRVEEKPTPPGPPIPPPPPPGTPVA